MSRSPARSNRTAASVLDREPAFILGNGPFLPADLARLDGFFTVGVNRILEHYDPTVVMWLDANVVPRIRPLLAQSKALRIARRQAAKGLAWPLTPSQSLSPDTFVDCKNSGVSAAYWAMSLGCRPIYLAGMSATYKGNQTDSYGVNAHHDGSTLGRLRRAVTAILGHPSVFAVKDQEQLNDLCRILRPCRQSRRFYLDRLARLYPGQRAAPSSR